ncbi:unnamed protein product [Clavelina lepadiformis]|uniref:Uncharacterized protein n=1 Tax=Clavelina lepadiformis TaxID=159417 RepID=A0ABP0G0P8_CLALP
MLVTPSTSARELVVAPSASNSGESTAWISVTIDGAKSVSSKMSRLKGIIPADLNHSFLNCSRFGICSAKKSTDLRILNTFTIIGYHPVVDSLIVKSLQRPKECPIQGLQATGSNGSHDCPGLKELFINRGICIFFNHSKNMSESIQPDGEANPREPSGASVFEEK